MHERLELKTNRKVVALTTLWPMVAAIILVTVMSLLLMPAALTTVLIMMGIIVALTFVICMPMYVGKYLFLPSTEYKGARIIGRLGKSETEISGVCRADVIVKQNFIEKAFKCCHIRMKGTSIYYRGVPEVEQVKAWINANFPEKTAAMLYAESRAKGMKKK